MSHKSRARARAYDLRHRTVSARRSLQRGPTPSAVWACQSRPYVTTAMRAEVRARARGRGTRDKAWSVRVRGAAKPSTRGARQRTSCPREASARCFVPRPAPPTPPNLAPGWPSRRARSSRRRARAAHPVSPDLDTSHSHSQQRESESGECRDRLKIHRRTRRARPGGTSVAIIRCAPLLYCECHVLRICTVYMINNVSRQNLPAKGIARSRPISPYILIFNYLHMPM